MVYEPDEIPLTPRDSKTVKFDESVGFNDARPCQHWVPSPTQIKEWTKLVRAERTLPKNPPKNRKRK